MCAEFADLDQTVQMPWLIWVCTFACMIKLLLACESLVTSIALKANSAQDSLLTFFYIVPENRVLTFHAIVSLGDDLHEIFNPIF